MAQKTNSFERFWKELKRRKVVHVITVYAAIAFVILQVTNMVVRPLRLPDWTEAFVIFLLCIGFVIAIFLSWVYDITPAGVKKTKPVSAIKHSDQTTAPISSGWKIATYISVVIILALVAFNISTRRNTNKDPIGSEKSIAVLPFKLLSDEPDKQFMADGIMDAITLHLSKIEDLRVMARTSVEQYRGTTKTSRTIGQELNVEYLLEGSFQKYGDNVKLIVQLIKAREESHKWGNEYNSKWGEIFSLQSEVAQKIASALNAVISPEEKQLIEKIPTTDLTAYDYFLKAKVEHFKYIEDYNKNINNIDAREKAKSLFKKTLETDSTFAQAYSGLANIYLVEHRAISYFEKDYLDSALFLADISLLYDKNLEEAYLVKSDYYQLNGNKEKALEVCEKAIEINPNYWQAYLKISTLYGDNIKKLENLYKAANLVRSSELIEILENIAQTYRELGIADKAKQYYEEILSLNADTIEYLLSLNSLDNNLGDFDKVIEGAKIIISNDSSEENKFRLYYRLGYSYSVLGNHSEAYKYWSEIEKEIPEAGIVTWVHRIGYSFSQVGKKEEAEKYFQKQINVCQEAIKLDKKYALDGGAYYDLAGVYAFKGDKEKAYQYLDQMVKILDNRNGFTWWLSYDPLFNSIRNEEHFQKILQNMKAKSQAERERVRKWLMEQGML